MSGPLPRLIVCAAMLMDDGNIIMGTRHFSPDMRAIMKLIYGEYYHMRVRQQGFIDQKGIFLTRTEAWKVAEAAGQIRRRVGNDHVDGGTLYSENLY